jgi:ABC-type thiamin/hydroxymethylpyrimidine transport system permease subunit
METSWRLSSRLVVSWLSVLVQCAFITWRSHFQYVTQLIVERLALLALVAT